MTHAGRPSPSSPSRLGAGGMDRARAYWLPRAVHPVAWWAWALGLAAAATRTTNPLLLLLIVAVAALTVVSRRCDTPWGRAFRMYLLLGAVIVVMRVAFRVVFGGGDTGAVLLHLPEIPLPGWAAGIRLLGDVTVTAVLSGLYDGLRLATMIVCVGAGNALANPKRLLRSVPTALYDVGTAVVIAVSVFPQLAESVVRVQRARRLRGGPSRGRHAISAVVIPVLADALDRSLLLAAAMDARGYGRHGTASARSRLVTGTLTIAGLIGVCVGIYSVLDGTTPQLLALVMLLAGLVVASSGLVAASRRTRTTRYRPDRFDLAAWGVALSGVAAGVAMALTGQVDPAVLNPEVNPPVWPALSLLPLVGVLAAALPAWLTPPPALTGGTGSTPEAAPTPLRLVTAGGAR